MRVCARAQGADPRSVSHEGHPGWEIDDLHNIIGTWTAFAPDAILLHIGTNDIGKVHACARARALARAARGSGVSAQTPAPPPRRARA